MVILIPALLAVAALCIYVCVAINTYNESFTYKKIDEFINRYKETK